MAEFNVEEFVKDVLLDTLNGLLKAQLKEVALHLGVDISQCSWKAQIREAVVKHLGLEQEVSQESDTRPKTNDTPTRESSESRASSTQIELARLELGKRKSKIRKFEVRNRVDQTKNSARHIDIAYMAKNMAKFEEEKVESFFKMCERTAKNLEWEETIWSMVLQQK